MLQTRLRAFRATRSLYRFPQRRYDSSKDGSKGSSIDRLEDRLNEILKDGPVEFVEEHEKDSPKNHSWHSETPLHQSEDETQVEYHPPDLKPQEPATHPPTESFSWKFFASFLALPAIYFIAQDVRSATPDNPPRLTRLITDWIRQRDVADEARNLRFMALIEQAAFDRALFQHANRRQNIEQRMPELLGVSSPWAVPAGHTADLTEVMEFYHRKNRENDERIRSLTPQQVYAYGGDAPPEEREEKKG